MRKMENAWRGDGLSVGGDCDGSAAAKIRGKGRARKRKKVSDDHRGK